MSSSNSPCAACKCLRRKCTQECVFAPYFPPDNPQKFINVHKVYGASNVAKLLGELNAAQREDAVASLAYEADYRLRDPIYGCVGLISILQQRLKHYQMDVAAAKKELATYIGPSAFLPVFQHPGFLQQQHFPNNPSGTASVAPYNMHQPLMGFPAPGGAQLTIREPQQPPQQQHQLYEAQAAQQYAEAVAARELQQQQEMYRAYEHHHHHQQQQQTQSQLQQQELTQDARFNAGFDGTGQVSAATGYNQPINVAVMSVDPSSALDDTYEGVPYHQIPAQQLQPAQEHSPSSQQHQYHQFHIQSQEMLQQQNQSQPAAQPLLQQMQLQFQSQTIQEQSQRAQSSDDGRSACPSC